MLRHALRAGPQLRIVDLILFVKNLVPARYALIIARLHLSAGGGALRQPRYVLRWRCVLNGPPASD
ncbi:hypothetical protein XaplCFBP3123_07120 [Xanthomonas arboricola pv. populi]|nr:hypothetical protein XaplCFBP3123_07120 [Xanthomonas arboricola pv. populi]